MNSKIKSLFPYFVIIGLLIWIFYLVWAFVLRDAHGPDFAVAVGNIEHVMGDIPAA